MNQWTKAQAAERRKLVSVYLPISVAERVRQAAEALGVSQSDFVAGAVASRLREFEKAGRFLGVVS